MVECNFHKQVRQSANLVNLEQRARRAFRVRCVCQKNALNPVVRMIAHKQIFDCSAGLGGRHTSDFADLFVTGGCFIPVCIDGFFPVLEQRRTFWDARGLDSDLKRIPNRCRLTKIHVSVVQRIERRFPKP